MLGSQVNYDFSNGHEITKNPRNVFNLSKTLCIQVSKTYTLIFSTINLTFFLKYSSSSFKALDLRKKNTLHKKS